MFQYNFFWHYWFLLNNRHYYNAAAISLASTYVLFTAPFVISPLVILMPSLVIGGALSLFTQLSKIFYNRQNNQLKHIKAETSDPALKSEIDLYLDRRVVCPQELLAGKRLNLSHNAPKVRRAVAKPPLTLEAEDKLTVAEIKNPFYQRNVGYQAKGDTHQLFMKKVKAMDGLSEVAAREMAEILGFEGLIPSNTIGSSFPGMPDADSMVSRDKIKKLIDEQRKQIKVDIKNTPGVQNALSKVTFNMRNLLYRIRARKAEAKQENLELLYVQKFIPNAVDGTKLVVNLLNEPIAGEVSNSTPLQKESQRDYAKNLIKNINVSQFQRHFLLHLVLGSQDANPGNTLFAGPNENLRMHSIDNERIMPENNYSVTKKIPLQNGVLPCVEKDLKDVFPIRLWLAGLPQADLPFARDTIEHALESLNVERLLAYHQRKKLFSSAAVGAQIDRIKLIKDTFAEEIKKSEITLTPKALFLKFINNHPTYQFLTELGLSAFRTFMLLGQVPEGSDWSLWRHPLQFFPMLMMAVELERSQGRGAPQFTEESFKSYHAHNMIFFSTAYISKMSDDANKAGLDKLKEVTQVLRV